MSRLTRRGVISGGFASVVATLSPTSLSGASTGASVTTSGSVAIAASGGSGVFTYGWERVSGSTGIAPVAPSSPGTAFTATGMSQPETRSAVWRGKVTDMVTGAVALTSNTVSIALERSLSAISAYLSPSSLEGSGQGASISTSGSVTVYASGGSGSFSYSWERVSGSTGPSPSSGSSAVTAFSTSSIAQGANQTAVWRCRVTDDVTGASTVTDNVTVSLTRGYASLSVSVAPAALTGVGNSATVVTSGGATATVSGGSGSWTGAWEWDGGATTGSIVATNPNNATTTFRSGDAQAPGTSRGQGLRFRVTDTVTGAQAVSNSVGVNLTRYAALSASVSPSSLTGSSQNTPVVTSGSATCTASGGSGSYTYAWEWDGGNSSGLIVPVAPSSASTAFQSGDSQASGTTRGRGFRCRVTDTVTGDVVVSNSVRVDLTRGYVAMTVGVSPASLSGSGTAEQVDTSGSATVSVSGGSGNFSYQWIYDGTGTGGLNPINGTSGTTAFRSASGWLNPGQTITAGFFCRVTDNATGETKDTGSVGISLTRSYASMTVSVSPSSLSGSGANSEVYTSASATVSVSGGSGSFSYLWEQVSGSGIAPYHGSSATTDFGGNLSPSQTVTGAWRCKVTDTITSEVKHTLSVSISLTRTAAPISYVAVLLDQFAWSAPSNPDPVFASATHDGVGPFTYAWTAVPSAGTTIDTPSLATTNVSQSSGNVGVIVSCVVTDLGAGGVQQSGSSTINGYNQ